MLERKDFKEEKYCLSWISRTLHPGSGTVLQQIVVDAICKETCAEDDNWGGQGGEEVDGHFLLHWGPCEAAVGARTAAGAAVGAAMTHQGTLLKQEEE